MSNEYPNECLQDKQADKRGQAIKDGMDIFLSSIYVHTFFLSFNSVDIANKWDWIYLALKCFFLFLSFFELQMM